MRAVAGARPAQYHPDSMGGGGRGRWETTRWTLVLAAGGTQTAVAREALAVLCETYWYPLYAYVRAQGSNPDDARDLVQSFLLTIIERDEMADLRPERGRFRAFLLVAMRHFLSNARTRERAQKRGGGRLVEPLEFDSAEDRFRHEPLETTTPETLYQRAWATALFDTVFRRISAEWNARGKGEEFARLKDSLMGDAPPGGYSEVARQLDTTEAAVKMATHRLKRRFLTELRAEVADTTSDEDVEEELRFLLKALQR
ncbi:MAG: hypothetical protein U0163_00330 [Gemmatimonadaceae bacterium]